MRSPIFVDFTPNEDVQKTYSAKAWKPQYFVFPPYRVVSCSTDYMLTLGSANASQATISQEGIVYHSGLHVFRHEFKSRNPHEPLVNVSHYVAGTVNDRYSAVYQIHDETHWLKPDDPCIDYMPLAWQYCIRNLLSKSRYSVGEINQENLPQLPHLPYNEF